MDFNDLKPLEIIPYGIELMNQQDYRNAILAFNEGLKHVSNSPVAFIGSALCKFELLKGNPNIEETNQLYKEIESDLRNALIFFTP